MMLWKIGVTGVLVFLAMRGFLLRLRKAWAQAEEIRVLTARLLTAQEDERRRLSRELHGDLNQELAMLAVALQTLEQSLPSAPHLIQDRLQALQKGVAGVSDDVRRLGYQLYPSILDDLGLTVAMEAYIADYTKREGIRVRFTHRNLPISLPPDSALCLYRVAQESLRNVAKHAGASHVAITLAGASESLHLSVQDDGVGFAPEAAGARTGGVGILSMRERVRLMQGRFSVEAHPGQGTSVSAWIPLSVGTA